MANRRHPSIPNSLLRPRRPDVVGTATAWLPGVFIAAGVLASSANLRQDHALTSQRLQIVAAAALFVSIIVAARAYRAPLKLSLATGATMLGFVFSRIATGPVHSLVTPARWDGPAEVLGAVAVVAMVGALMVFVQIRRGGGLRSILADTLLVGLVGWVVTWIVMIEPTLQRSPAPEWLILVRGSIRAMALPAAFLLVLVYFSGSRRTFAVRLVVGAIAAAMVANLMSGLVDAEIVTISTARAETTYILGFFLAAAAFSHRSIGRLAEPVPFHRSHSPLTRILMTIACLPVPAALLTLTAATDGLDQTVRIVSLLGLSAAITLRVADAIHTNNAAQLSLLRHAQQDVLTGLPNRTLLGARISEALDAADVIDVRPTLLFIGLDRFKNVNDSLSHDVGDEVLRMVARRLQTAMPRHAHVGRISGDEFVVLDAEIATMGEASQLAERALSLFREPFRVGGGDVYLSASIGVAVANRGSFDPQELQRNADTAMGRAKDAGGNCVQVFDDAMYERVFHRLEIESGLHRALERRELHLYYQPIVDLVSGQLTGFEALMRWQRADGRIVSPAEFIPVAEETGLIIGIGNWALLEGMTQLRSWIDEGICSRDTAMSINVSPRQLQDPSLFSAVDEALRRARVPARNIWLEVTESVMISEPDQALGALRRLRSLGVRLAIDDFGTGYSSLSALRNFPLQRIKIDRSFISGMTLDENADALVRTIVAMADSLSLDLVAEGLESREQLRALTAMGCRKAQGFLIASPVHAGAMPETIRNLSAAGLWTGGLQLSWPDD